MRATHSYIHTLLPSFSFFLVDFIAHNSIKNVSAMTIIPYIYFIYTSPDL